MPSTRGDSTLYPSYCDAACATLPDKNTKNGQNINVNERKHVKVFVCNAVNPTLPAVNVTNAGNGNWKGGNPSNVGIRIHQQVKDMFRDILPKSPSRPASSTGGRNAQPPPSYSSPAVSSSVTASMTSAVPFPRHGGRTPTAVAPATVKPNNMVGTGIEGRGSMYPQSPAVAPGRTTPGALNMISGGSSALYPSPPEYGEEHSHNVYVT